MLCRAGSPLMTTILRHQWYCISAIAKLQKRRFRPTTLSQSIRLHEGSRQLLHLHIKSVTDTKRTLSDMRPFSKPKVQVLPLQQLTSVSRNPGHKKHLHEVS